jgi:hypothetical protein
LLLCGGAAIEIHLKRCAIIEPGDVLFPVSAFLDASTGSRSAAAGVVQEIAAMG